VIPDNKAMAVIDVFDGKVFIDRLKTLLEANKVIFKPRNEKKTWEFMLAEGLFEDDVFRIVSCLLPEHYVWGPENDRDGSGGNVMLFFYPYMDRCKWRCRCGDLFP
jgi:hypothetical protein